MRFTFKALSRCIVCSLLVLALCGCAGKYNDYYETAEFEYFKKNYDEALVSAEKALAEEETVECYLLLSKISEDMGNTEEAINYLYLGYSKFGDAELAERLEELKKSDDIKEPEAVQIKIAGIGYPEDSVSLVLTNKNLTDSDIDVIASFELLQSLSISDNDITDISVLSSLSQLNFLQLSNNHITDLSPLSGLTSLKTLYLDGNPITDYSPLYGLTELRTLSLKGIALTSEQLAAISQALPECSIYTELEEDTTAETLTIAGKNYSTSEVEMNLSGCGITDLSELTEFTQLVKLDLSDNTITDLSPLMELPNLQWLNLSGNSISDIYPLMGLSGLVYLNLTDNDVEDISPVGYLEKLETLILDGNPIEGVSPLLRLSNLQSLSLKDTGLLDAHLTLLQQMTSLTSLALEDNPKLTANEFDKLEDTLTGCAITHSQLLYTFSTGKQTFTSDATILTLNNIGFGTLEGLEHFTWLESLSVAGNGIYDISPLEKLMNLQTLELYNNNISDISALSGHKSLRSLSLVSNNISNISPLSSCTGLTELHLSYNKCSNISPLSKLTGLKVLDLDSCGITDISPLSGLTSLTELSLDGNNISDLTPLYNLHSLKTLYIQDNAISQEEILALIDALPNCTIYHNVEIIEQEPEDGLEDEFDGESDIIAD